MDGLYLESGDIIDGRYQIREMIGRGGMSVVYLAADLRVGRDRAVKVVGKTGNDRGRKFRRSVTAEIDILRNLSHSSLPEIVDVLDDGERLFIVMEYLRGETLLSLVRRVGAIPEERAVGWALQLTEVLAYLHGQRPPIIYRDMKPGNVMLCGDGRIVLFDFGIAREYKTESTADTVCLGTIGYAAPEQFGGGQTDERTDIYGLGATLYHLLTGLDPARPPYRLRPIREINPGLSSGLEKIILRCTAPNPADRYGDCGELRQALLHFRRLEEVFLRGAKKRLVLFFIPVLLGMGAILAGGAFSARTNAARRSSYAGALARAGDFAAKRLYEGRFDPEVVECFARAMETDPSRKEAYLQLLDYGLETGGIVPALSAVCGRIDAGAGGIDRCDELLYRVGELYFGGWAEQGLAADYRKAAAYFAKIDETRYPEAALYADIAAALGNFSREIDWKEIGSSLTAFAARNKRRKLDEQRIRNGILCAGVYMANRGEFEAAGVDACREAAAFLRAAAKDAAVVMDAETVKDAETAKDAEAVMESGGGPPAGKAAELRKQALSDLAGICILDDETVKEAVELLRELCRLETEPERLWELRLREAAAVQLGGEPSEVRKVFRRLIADYPKEPDGYLGWCAWLLERGETAEAAEVFAAAEKLEGVENGANYTVIRERLGRT